jgi:hypothetical protein
MATIDTLETGYASIQWVAAIEGFDRLITDGSTSAAVTAWSGTEWSAAIGGLQVSGVMRQTMRPWSAEVDVGHITLVVQPDESDTLGLLLFASNAGEETTLTAALDCNDTTVTVKSTSAFPSSGSIHIGTEHITYTGKTATTFTTCTRGRYSPFKANTESAQRFGRAHPLAAVGDGYVVQPRVTTQQRTWVGRWVGLWVHARNGSTLDTVANARLVFAGRIVGFRDETNGLSYIELESASALFKDCVLFRDQWVARVAEGILLHEGERFQADDYNGSALTANALIVVASGASGANQMNAGRYTLETLANALNRWFASEKTAARLNFGWTWTPLLSDEGVLRSEFRWTSTSANVNLANFRGPRDVIEFMGFTGDGFHRRITFNGTTQTYMRSQGTPCKTYMRTGGSNLIEIEDVRGTWWNNQPYIPADLGATNLPAGSYALLQIGEESGLILCKEETPGSTISMVANRHVSLLDLVSNGANLWQLGHDFSRFRRITADSESEFEIKQVAVIAGDFADLITQFLASTGTSGYNHADYDVFPDQFGAAIPWQILGDGWVNSANHIAEAGASVQVTLEKPTKLTEVIGADLVARLAAVTWHAQTLQIALWSAPASAVAEHVLSESNKAIPIDASEDQRTVAIESDDYIVNAIKLEYNRDRDGGSYRSTLNIINKTSQYELGLHRPVTISLRNLYGGQASANATVEKLADHLSGVVPVFSKPMRIIRRTIAPELYEAMALGDVCVISDDFVRDPVDGTRGIANRACLVLSKEIDFGGYEIDSGRVRPPLGQVDLLLWPRDSVVAYSPCAQVDRSASGGGYNAGSKTLTFYESEHSFVSQDPDVSNFAAGDKVRIIEIDPDDPAAPQTWTDTIVSVNSGANTCVLTTGLGGFNSSLHYRMISDNYSNAVLAQKAQVYQADDADNLVVDDIPAYEYGTNPTVSTSSFAEAGVPKVSLYATAAYGDGVPLDVGYERDAARLVNNLVSYRTAPMMPCLIEESIAIAGHVRVILAIEPLFIGAGSLGSGSRSLIVRLWCRCTSGTNKNGYVTLSKLPPHGYDWEYDTTLRTYQWNRPYQTEQVVAASTTWGASSQVVLDAGIADNPAGECYITIEGEPGFEYRGLAMCHVGPYVGP